MKRLKFKDKTVLITGASSGIGKSMAKYLIEKYNCRIYAIARNLEKLSLVAAELGENYIPYSLDVSNGDGWADLSKFFEENNINIDVLINCAGVLPEFKSFDKTEINELENVLKINFLADAYSIKALLPFINDGGAIVNISSASALCPFGGVSIYSASKAALDNFSVSIANEQKSVSVSSVLPGFVRTDIMKNQSLNNKEAKLIRAFSADSDKVSRKILKRVAKRKGRIIVGKDAHLLNFLYKHFPRLAPKLITKFLRKSGLSLFSKI